VKPPFTYYGSKGRLAPWIASMLPEHRLYFEPFAGSAAVLFAKAPATHEVINDISESVTTFFRVLRDRPEDLRAALALTPYARDEYLAAALDVEDLDEIERARRFFVRTTQSFNGGGTGPAHRVSWANGMRSSGGSRAAGVRRIVDNLHQVAERLRSVIVENRAYEHLLELYDGERHVFYVDPPYLGSTRSSLDPSKRRGRDYMHDLTTDAQHVELAEHLHALRAQVLLSGYHSPLYDELYGDWDTVEVSVARPSGNRRGHSAPPAVEVLWSNRPLATQGTLLLEASEAVA
jgi:DNA adenine methylase